MTQFQPPPPANPFTQSGLKPHRGGTILTLGILSLVLGFGCGIGFLLGIIGWVMAKADLAEMDAGIMDPAGRSNTQAGKICSIISIILAAIGIVLAIIYFVVVVLILGVAAASSSGSTP
ncbi:MAG: hypothetical protein KF768_09465 [Phycisphaeraceae bacterium]|nr:hypothetical protein [Phycisphaeraceae bacterium]